MKKLKITIAKVFFVMFVAGIIGAALEFSFWQLLGVGLRFIFFVCAFSLIVFFILKIIYKIRHKSYTKSPKSLIIKLGLLFAPLYIGLFVAGGYSYKYIDPEYYYFKRLCYRNVGKILIGSEPTNAPYDYTNYDNQQTHSIGLRIQEINYEIEEDKKIIFSKNITYLYSNYGIFYYECLGECYDSYSYGYEKTLECNDIDKTFRRW